MLRIRSKRLLSGASAIALIAGVGMVGTATAAETFPGPLTTPPITNDQTDTVTINANATIDKNAGTNASNTAASTNGDSFFNNLTMTGAGTKLLIDDSYLLGDIENTGTMLSTDSEGIFIGKDSQVGGRLFNSGLIQGGGAGNHGVELANDSTIAGGIVNTGTIQGLGGVLSDGISVGTNSEIFGGIYNSGLISGFSDGIAFDGTAIDFFGGITNTSSGTIQAGTSAGIEWSSSGNFTGGVGNSGVITGDTGIYIGAGTFGGGITNLAGRITGETVAAIRMTGGTFNGDITNSSTIEGLAGAHGILISGGTFNGKITNNANGTISALGGSTAIFMSGGSITGGISNAGRILGQSSGGQAIAISGGTFGGGITNLTNGRILASSNAINISGATAFSGGITNSGSIFGGVLSNAIVISGTSTFNGDITNNTGGVINGGTGIRWSSTGTFTGNIVNNGSIIGAISSGIYLTGTTFTGSVTNGVGALISALDTGIHIGSTTAIGGSITNNGTILADTNNGGIGVGILLEAGGSVAGDIINAGTIDPLIAMVISGSVTGVVSNTGLAIGTNTAIQVNSVPGGGITNSGTAIGGTNGITVAGVTTGASTIRQTGGLIRGNSQEDGSGTVTTALRLDQTGTERDDSFYALKGVLDGNLVGGAGSQDALLIQAASGDTWAYLRGTATDVYHIDFTTNGTAVFGSSARGVDGAGVTFNTSNHFSNGGEGRAYLDDNTTINVADYYSQSSGATLEFYLTSDTTTHGQINAATTITLAGNIAAYVAGTTFGSVGGDTFTYENVLTTASLSGTFANAGDIETNSLFFTGVADVNPTFVDIILTRGSFSSALILPGMTQNEMSVGDVLDDIYALGPGPGGYGTDFAALFDYLLSLGAGDEELALAIYNELGGAEHAQLQQTTLDILNPFNTSMGQRLDAAKTTQGNFGFASFGGSQYAANSAIMTDAASGAAGRSGSGVSLWARGFGQMLDVDGDPEAPGYDQDTGGVVGGIDFAVGQNSLIGVAAGWSTTDVDFSTPGDNADVDSFQVGAYGSAGFGRFYLDAEVAGAFHDLTTTRVLNLPNPPGGTVAGANYDARSLSATAEFGGVWRSGNWLFQPNAGLAFTDVDTDTFIESGAGDFNLIVNGSDAQSLASTLGARIATQFKSGGMRIMPEISASWRHEFEDDRQSFTAAFPDDPSSTFTIISSKISEDSALVGAGVTAGVSRSVEIFVNYNGLLNSDVDVHNGSAGLRATW